VPSKSLVYQKITKEEEDRRIRSERVPIIRFGVSKLLTQPNDILSNIINVIPEFARHAIEEPWEKDCCGEGDRSNDRHIIFTANRKMISVKGNKIEQLFR